MIKAIETRYKGYRFRSRLEARWAAFFDALGVAWEYEKQGYHLPSGNYLPDFWLPIAGHGALWLDAGYWVEIKPVSPTEEEEELLTQLAAATGHNAFLLAGNVGVHEFTTSKACCVRTLGGLERMISDARSGPNRTARLIITKGTGPGELRIDDDGNIHPEDRAAFLVRRSDPQEFVFPFSELVALADNPSRDRFLDAYRAARAARFEHGETPR